MRPVNQVTDDITIRTGDAPISRREPAGEASATDDPRPEPRVDLDERTPEEAGYGYGV